MQSCRVAILNIFWSLAALVTHFLSPHSCLDTCLLLSDHLPSSSTMAEGLPNDTGFVDPKTNNFPGSLAAYCSDGASIVIGSLMGTSPVTVFVGEWLLQYQMLTWACIVPCSSEVASQ